MSKMLIIYYSQAMGNTKRIAEMVQKATGADIVSIETVTAYTGSYDDIVEQGKDEVNRGYKPAIKSLDVNIDDYDVIAVGTPTWWYTMAPAVLTFLSSQNWKGKTVIPFATHGGWPSHVIQDMKTMCMGAEIKCEKEIQFDSTGGDRLKTSISAIEEWINEIKALIQ